MILEGTFRSVICVPIWVAIWQSMVSTGFGSNILVVCPIFAKSVHIFHNAIARSLHAAGHQITIVHPFLNDTASQNFTVIDSSLPHQPNETNYLDTQEAMGISDVLTILLWLGDLSERNCHNTIQLEEIQKIIHSKDKQFDVMILDLMEPLHRCFMPIAEILDIPVIGACSGKSWWRADWLIANPNNPAAIPTALTFKAVKMKFIQRLTNLWYWTLEYLFEKLYILPKLDVIHKKHFANFSVARQIKPSLIFAYSQQILISRPAVTNVVNIGGIHMQSQLAKPLSQNLLEFIDGAKDGVILFTFGSAIRMFEESSLEFDVLKKAFAQIPQRVIWKMEHRVDDLPKNVMTSKWLPQREILAHKNVVAFITHCGLSGTFEAIFEAKPVIMMPIFFDQMSNSAILEELGVGIYLDIRKLTVEKVLEALNNIVQDETYRKRMQNISKIVKDAPFTEQEAVVYWTEYVIRHKGAPHLRTIAAEMPLYEYLLLDVILFVGVLLSTFVYFTKLLIRKIRSKKCQNSDSKKNK